MGNAIRREEAVCKEFMWFVLVLFLHLGPFSFRAENEIFLLFIQFGLDRKITIALTWDILLVFIWPWWIHILLLATGAKINDLQWTECVGYWWMPDLSLPMQPRSGNLVLENTLHCVMQSELMVSAYILTPPKWHDLGAGRLPPTPLCAYVEVYLAPGGFGFLHLMPSFVQFSGTFLRTRISKPLSRSEIQPQPKSLQLEQVSHSYYWFR